MKSAEKERAIENLSDQFRSLNSAFLVDYKGLKVVDATELRRKIRDFKGNYVVVKNTLALRATKNTKLELLGEHFSGPTAVVSHPRDVVGLAKLLTEVAKTNPNVAFKAALVEGKVVPASQIQAIAAMPSREVLLSKLAFLLKAPVQRLATVLKAPMRNFVFVLKQIPKSDS